VHPRDHVYERIIEILLGKRRRPQLQDHATQGVTRVRETGDLLDFIAVGPNGHFVIGADFAQQLICGRGICFADRLVSPAILKQHSE